MKKIVKIISFLYLFFALCAMPYISEAQSRKDLENQKQKVLKDINYTNKLLKENEKVRANTVSQLMLINKQVESRKELIYTINEEIKLIEKRIKNNTEIVEMLEADLKKLKDDYAVMINSAYKNRSSHNKIMFILSSKDFNQAYQRLKYIQQYSEFRKKQVAAIQSTQEMLDKQIENLKNEVNTKKQLLTEKNIETSKLEQEQNSQTKTLNNLKNKESELKRKLQQQQQSANKLQREIEKLIAEEARRSSGGKSTTYVLTPSEKIISTNFANNKGRLPWPVEKGVITSRFGKQAHPVIKNITIDNAGVDISTNPGANVRAIFDGEVRSVMSMPGAQNIVIIRHGEYLSVYTHLMSVNVKVGDHVNTKQNIGKVYTDIDENKTILHLEVWFKEAKENPAVWLAK